MTKPTWVPAWFTFNRVLIFGLIFAVIFLGYVSWCQPNPVDSQALLTEMRLEVQKKVTEDSKTRDETIKRIVVRLNAAEKNGIILSKKMEELKNEASNIMLPKSNKEIRDRFIKRGFPPKP